jgi:hypothetical protein
MDWYIADLCDEHYVKLVTIFLWAKLKLLKAIRPKSSKNLQATIIFTIFKRAVIPALSIYTLIISTGYLLSKSTFSGMAIIQGFKV